MGELGPKIEQIGGGNSKNSREGGARDNKGERGDRSDIRAGPSKATYKTGSDSKDATIADVVGVESGGGNYN